MLHQIRHMVSPLGGRRVCAGLEPRRRATLQLAPLHHTLPSQTPPPCLTLLPPQVGAAVAVARGTMPLELLEASLATPARVSLPLAPPSTLMLIGAQFRWALWRRAVAGTASIVFRATCPFPTSVALTHRRHGPGCPLCLPPCSPFKRSWSGQAAEAARWTGETLELKERGAAAQRSFLQQVMHPALDQMLAGEEWAQWCTDLDR